MTEAKGRPFRGLIGGLFLGIFVDIDLVFGGIVKLNSNLLTILPLALLVIGLLLGIWAPIGRASVSTPARAAAPAVAPSNVTTVPAAPPPEATPPADPAPPATEGNPPI